MKWIDNSSILINALDKCLTGGNHLVAPLMRELGNDFSEKYPPGADYWETLEKIGAGMTFDIWVCWREIMLAREMATTDDEALA